MNNIASSVIIGFISYALGNINPSIILGKIYKVDIKKEGSGNAGTTNTIRLLGLKAGILVLLIDAIKAVIAVRLGFALGGISGAMHGFAFVILGHCFPALWGFKGGKGVASSLGGAIALSPLSAICTIGVALLSLGFSRRMSVGSLLAAASFPIFIYLFKPEYFYFSIGLAIFIFIMHRENIKRLAKGEEKPLSFAKKKEKTKL